MAEEKFNGQNLIEILVNKYGFKKESAEVFLKEFFLLIEDGLEKDGIVRVKGLGTFKLIEVKSRESINVNTGERFEIQGHTKVSFLPETALRDAINKPFAHFETTILKDRVTFGYIQLGEIDSDFSDDSDMDDLDMPEPLDDAITEEPENKNIIVPLTIPESAISTESEEISIQEAVEDIDSAYEVINNLNTENDMTTENKNESEEKKIPEQNVGENPQKKDKDTNGRAVLIAILLTLLICGAAIFFFFFPGGKSGMRYPEERGTTPPVIVIDTAAIAQAERDSIENARKLAELKQKEEEDKKRKEEEDKKKEAEAKKNTSKAGGKTSTTANKSRKVNKTKSTTRKKELTDKEIMALPIKPDFNSYSIIGTKESYKVKAGETLTIIAYRKLGSKDLYPYLVQHNKKIVNPNSVPAGTIINIPTLKKK